MMRSGLALGGSGKRQLASSSRKLCGGFAGKGGEGFSGIACGWWEGKSGLGGGERRVRWRVPYFSSFVLALVHVLAFSTEHVSV